MKSENESEWFIALFNHDDDYDDFGVMTIYDDL
jgi:hypothetical protein